MSKPSIFSALFPSDATISFRNLEQLIKQQPQIVEIVSSSSSSSSSVPVLEEEEYDSEEEEKDVDIPSGGRRRYDSPPRARSASPIHVKREHTDPNYGSDIRDYPQMNGEAEVDVLMGVSIPKSEPFYHISSSSSVPPAVVLIDPNDPTLKQILTTHEYVIYRFMLNLHDMAAEDVVKDRRLLNRLSKFKYFFNMYTFLEEMQKINPTRDIDFILTDQILHDHVFIQLATLYQFSLQRALIEICTVWCAGSQQQWSWIEIVSNKDAAVRLRHLMQAIRRDTRVSYAKKYQTGISIRRSEGDTYQQVYCYFTAFIYTAIKNPYNNQVERSYLPPYTFPYTYTPFTLEVDARMTEFDLKRKSDQWGIPTTDIEAADIRLYANTSLKRNKLIFLRLDSLIDSFVLEEDQNKKQQKLEMQSETFNLASSMIRQCQANMARVQPQLYHEMELKEIYQLLFKSQSFRILILFIHLVCILLAKKHALTNVNQIRKIHNRNEAMINTLTQNIAYMLQG